MFVDWELHYATFTWLYYDIVSFCMVVKYE